MTQLLQRLKSDSPKRILSIDGGGIRGALALGFLSRLELLLRQRHGNDSSFRLSHYFDLIGGTSTGSIIAVCLSLGMSVDEIEKLYFSLGNQIFGRKLPWFKRLRAKFSPIVLQDALKEIIGDRTLGSPDLETGLCIVTKRADTGSTWPLINHPDGAFYENNKGILLRQAIRASTAAPTYFSPEQLEVGRGELGAFVDGGVSMYNNPALLLFLVATIQGYSFKWSTGEDKLLLVSIGTGSGLTRYSVKQVMNSRIWNWAEQVPAMLMRDASRQGHLMLQYLSNSPTRSSIDLEINNMQNDLLGKVPHLSYLRYNIELDVNQLSNIGILDVNVKALEEMSNAQNISILNDIGKKAAKKVMNATHFPESFDNNLWHQS
ncbi:patatin-like phospholipase family protein [Nostoc sp. CHAB 5834]|nr:patatin-like phospholipase family protein [Nostoc sp. CHAB 5834]